MSQSATIRAERARIVYRRLLCQAGHTSYRKLQKEFGRLVTKYALGKATKAQIDRMDKLDAVRAAKDKCDPKYWLMIDQMKRHDRKLNKLVASLGLGEQPAQLQ